MQRERRYPFAPLERQLLDRLPIEASGAKHLALLAGVSQRQVVRWRAEGLTATAAERAAVAAGFVPYELWPEMLDEAIASLERTCAADRCEQTFIPPDRVPGKKYCSDRCRKRTNMRAAYQRDPEPKRAAVAAYAARNKQVKSRANAYRYKTNREAMLAYQRTYYEQNRDQVLQRRRARRAA